MSDSLCTSIVTSLIVASLKPFGYVPPSVITINKSFISSLPPSPAPNAVVRAKLKRQQCSQDLTLDIFMMRVFGVGG